MNPVHLRLSTPHPLSDFFSSVVSFFIACIQCSVNEVLEVYFFKYCTELLGVVMKVSVVA